MTAAGFATVAGGFAVLLTALAGLIVALRKNTRVTQSTHDLMRSQYIRTGTCLRLIRQALHEAGISTDKAA